MTKNGADSKNRVSTQNIKMEEVSERKTIDQIFIDLKKGIKIL